MRKDSRNHACYVVLKGLRSLTGPQREGLYKIAFELATSAVASGEILQKNVAVPKEECNPAKLAKYKGWEFTLLVDLTEAWARKMADRINRKYRPSQ